MAALSESNCLSIHVPSKLFEPIQTSNRGEQRYRHIIYAYIYVYLQLSHIHCTIILFIGIYQIQTSFQTFKHDNVRSARSVANPQVARRPTKSHGDSCATVDGSFQNPGRTHQLRLVVYPTVYQVLAPSKQWLFGISEPSTVPCNIGALPH